MLQSKFKFGCNKFLKDADVKNFKNELRAMDEKIIGLGQDLKRLTNENAKMESETKSFESKIPITELKSTEKKLQDEVEELKERLAKIKNSKVEVISKDEKAKVGKSPKGLVF